MHGYGWTWPMGAMMFGLLLVTVLVVGLVVWLVVGYGRPCGVDGTGVARRILAERDARAELDADGYARRVAALR